MLPAMLLRLPRPALVRLMSLLLLATIGLQASEPPFELHSERGSAFSSATSDVAVAAKGRPESIRTALVPEPPMAPERPTGVSADRLRMAEPIAMPDSTGPPAFALVARQPAPRAPPLA